MEEQQPTLGNRTENNLSVCPVAKEESSFLSSARFQARFPDHPSPSLSEISPPSEARQYCLRLAMEADKSGGQRSPVADVSWRAGSHRVPRCRDWLPNRQVPSPPAFRTIPTIHYPRMRTFSPHPCPCKPCISPPTKPWRTGKGKNCREKARRSSE